MSLSHFVFVVFVASTTIAVADEVRPAAKDVPSKPLFAFEPLGRDKDRIPDGKATLAVVDGKLTAFATGFTLIAEAVPMPADGKVFFELQGVADKSLVIVSVNDREVWTYDGDKKNLVSSPPVEVKPKDNDPKKFKLQVTVGKGPFALGGIQTFVVREATMSRETAISTSDWLIESGIVASKYEGQDVGAGYTESRGLATVRINPEKDQRLVIVRYKIKAQTADPKAVEKLAQRRSELTKTGLERPLDDAEQKKLTGNYRMFDMEQFALIDADDKKHKLLWPVDHKGRSKLITNNAIVDLFDEPKAPWHETFLTRRSFTGLLEADKSVEIVFVVGLPQSTKLEGLRLQVESEKPVALKVDQSNP